MDRRDHHTKSKSERESQIPYDITCGIKNMRMDGFVYKTEVESQIQKTNLWLPGYKEWGGINWEIGTDIYTLLYIK